MKGILSLASITFKEGIRNRALFGIFIMALLAFALTMIMTSLFMRDIVRVAASLSLTTISFSGLLMIIFIGTSLLAKDIDKRTIYMVISRPLSRAEYCVGKFLGLSYLIGVSIAFLGIISSIPVIISGIGYDNPLAIFNWNVYFIAILFIAMKLLLIASVIIFWSAITSSSFISLILTIAVYIVGSTNEVVRGFLDQKMEGMNITPLMAGVIKFAYYVFPNLSAFDLKLQAANGIPVSAEYFVWTSVYGLVYISIMVSAAALAMTRREFP